MDAAQDRGLPFQCAQHSKAPGCGALGQQQKPNRRLPGKAALEFCDKVEGEKESDALGDKASCSALCEGMFSVICTTGTVKSASTRSWDFTILYFRDPTFQIVTPTSIPNESSKTLEISERQWSHREQYLWRPAQEEGINPLSAGGEAGKPVLNK